MMYAPLTSPMLATCPAHLILLALITLTILGEEYKPCSKTICRLIKFYIGCLLLVRSACFSPPYFQFVHYVLQTRSLFVPLKHDLCKWRQWLLCWRGVWLGDDVITRIHPMISPRGSMGVCLWGFPTQSLPRTETHVSLLVKCPW
jgi:hypothetical protein